MIAALDTLIQRSLISEIPALANRIGFQPPDQAWRDQVSAQPGDWLNCALVDLREDRSRRATGVRVEPDPTRRVLPPFRLRCHYLISAWNSVRETSPAVSGTRAEHALLGRVITALVERIPLRPGAVLTPGELASLPELWREAELDTELLPPEGFGKVAEFWQSMGASSPWRPVVWLAVTVPVAPHPRAVDGVVTTVISSLSRETPPRASETLLGVAGLVRDQSGSPVAGALILVSDTSGQLAARTTSGSDGEFVVAGLSAGSYTFTARAVNQPPFVPVQVSIPAPAIGPVHLQPA